MTNWKERAEQHISSQERTHLELKRAQEERLQALEAQRAQEMHVLWEALNVPQQLRRINSDLWRNMGEVVTTVTSAALRFRYQWPDYASSEDHSREVFGFYKEDVHSPTWSGTGGEVWGGGKIGERVRFGKHRVHTGRTLHYEMENRETGLSIEVTGGGLPPSHFALIVSRPSGRGRKEIQCGQVNVPELKEFVDQVLLQDCSYRLKEGYLPEDFKRKAEERERQLRSEGFVRK